MASVQSIGRLYKIEPESAPVKLENCANSPQSAAAPPPVESRPRRFRIAREEAQSYTLDAGAIKGHLEAAGPLDRSGAFREIADREKVMQLIAARVHRAANRVRFVDAETGSRLLETV